MLARPQDRRTAPRVPAPEALPRRGRLYRKLATLLVALVASALTVTAAVEAWYSYLENRAAQVAIQREKAQGAAAVIEQFLKEIEGQLGWTTLAGTLPGASSLDQRRLDFLRLLRQAPPITEVTYIDPSGREQLRVSRLAMDAVGGGTDRSADPVFRDAVAKGRYVSAVYFRKESEPYLTLAITGSSRRGGVVVAEVNLKFIWDVISRIKVGTAGIAFAVDNRGLLIAHPDIGLVLRKSDFSQLAQVRAGPSATSPDAPAIATDWLGRDVLTANAVVEPIGWRVFVEQPVDVALEPLRDSLLRTGILSLLGIVIAALLGLWLAHRLTVPIEALAQAAGRIGAGDLGHRIPLATGDEAEVLARSLNDMASRLQESYAGLERKVEERTRELQETLEYQTATSEVLGVISKSPNNLTPVLEVIGRTAARLCESDGGGAIFLLREDGRFHYALGYWPQEDDPFPAYAKANPVHPDQKGSVTARAARQGEPVHVPDSSLDPEAGEGPLGIGPARTVLAVPLLRNSAAVGVIVLRRSQVRPFSRRQIELVETFADQAVIAIENARLFDEVQARTAELSRSVAELKALGEVGQAVSSSLDVQTVLGTILEHACHLADASGGTIHVIEAEGAALSLAASHKLGEALTDALRQNAMRPSDAMSAQSLVSGRSEQIADIRAYPDHPMHAMLQAEGIRSLLAVPLRHQNRTTGILFVGRRAAGTVPDETVRVLEAFASQSSIAINNARLFRALEEQGEQLRIASLHKSQFLANMSHELRTPLNAILGYSELIQDGVYGELQPKVGAVLERVQTNGRHLLGLINDVLDLSKIEAGQLVLRLDDYSMADLVQTAVTTTESLAAEKGLALEVEIAPQMPVGRGDAQRITQVVLNLLGNAIKFTDAGKVRIAARAKARKFVLTVADTGPGIAPEEQTRIFEEFHQVDSSNTKRKGGTGLGLAISRRIVALHGGRLSVASEPGRGSVFRVDLPIRVEQQRGLP